MLSIKSNQVLSNGVAVFSGTYRECISYVRGTPVTSAPVAPRGQGLVIKGGSVYSEGMPVFSGSIAECRAKYLELRYSVAPATPVVPATPVAPVTPSIEVLKTAFEASLEAVKEAERFMNKCRLEYLAAQQAATVPVKAKRAPTKKAVAKAKKVTKAVCTDYDDSYIGTDLDPFTDAVNAFVGGAL